MTTKLSKRGNVHYDEGDGDGWRSRNAPFVIVRTILNGIEHWRCPTCWWTTAPLAFASPGYEMVMCRECYAAAGGHTPQRDRQRALETRQDQEEKLSGLGHGRNGPGIHAQSAPARPVAVEADIAACGDHA